MMTQNIILLSSKINKNIMPMATKDTERTERYKLPVCYRFAVGLIVGFGCGVMLF